MKKPKALVSVRIDPDHLKELKKRKLDLTTLVRDAISDAVDADVCPTCGHSLKPIKKK